MSTPPPMIYVAGKYSGDVETNIATAEITSIALIKNGFHVFTPHKNTAGYEKYEGITMRDGGTITRDTWLQMDMDMLSRCDALYVMRGWHHSTGTMAEILYAERNNIPVYYEINYPVDTFTPGIHYGRMRHATNDNETEHMINDGGM